MRRRHLGALLLLACAFLLPPEARSNVVIGGTRIIYPAAEREVTLRLTNEGGKPALVQAWIDDGDLDSNPDETDVPFVIMPPLARVNPRMGQTLRIAYIPQPGVATDRESVFWMNALDVPPLPSAQVANHMQLAFRSRIKLFFRPAGLSGTPREAAERLNWRVVVTSKGAALKVRNDSAFHVSLTAVTVRLGNGRDVTVPAQMLSPRSVTDLGLGKLSNAAGAKGAVAFEWINDYGAAERRESPLEP
ncbi:fimbria/pilus periplasmic chaperone [Achromobacter spanius]|uniref:Fimbria/pilus periplasmic chaperone n=1 Tax=Achromobacter spanius TaxID=217203 RepID=A0ABY8GQE6_9BURK|nr:fimbria/pilus periplasmic chaperone [Achromobacter spanius]WAI83805.1 fimbria/pilus periplasmic chaperone [Achromobacter spanius]WFP06951.1 fimbria/pilus periplasmic chaperone [Achromobacter spanius]